MHVVGCCSSGVVMVVVLEVRMAEEVRRHPRVGV